jgi:hypothetical protein
MDTETLHTLLGQTRHLRRRFASTAPRSWDPAAAGAELTVQLGHLALCLLRRGGADVSGLEDPDRPITDIGDELADVVLSGLSVTVLAEREPASTAAPAPTEVAAVAGKEISVFLRLLVTAGWLAEAGLVTAGYRHRPTGTPPSVAEAGSALLAACEELAGVLGVDVAAEFGVMTANADAFLDARSLDSRSLGPGSDVQ